MAIKLRDYDLDAARTRLRKRVFRDRGVIHDYDGKLSPIETEIVRRLNRSDGVNAPMSLAIHLLDALSTLPVALGGTVAAVEGGYAALPEHVTPAVPLVQALMVVRGHPCCGDLSDFPLQRAEQAAGYPSVNIGRKLEAMHRANPQKWSVARFESIVFEAAKRFCGDVEIDPLWTPEVIYPGSKVGQYTSLIRSSFVFDAFGAFDPAFTRRDALAGDWWLLQPVSPRLRHHFVAQPLGLNHLGFLPPAHVDVAGRMVMACMPTQEIDDARRIRIIEDCKWIAGWQQVRWSRSKPPLTDPAFDLVKLEGSTVDYRHSGELPPWPRPR